MDPRLVVSVTGLLLLVVAASMLGPLAIAWADGDMRALTAYGVTAGLTIGVGLAMHYVTRRAGEPTMHRKDAFGVVALTWLCLGIFGAIPFIVEGSIRDVPGAIFEAVSGFTTTGATVVADVGALSRATNLWRCEMHWLGGMGVVVLFVAIFPQLGVGAKQLFKTEVAGPTADGLRPRIKQTALTLWWVYAGLTALCAATLWGLGLSPFDAIVHAFSTLGTGGFSNRTASVGHFASPAVDWVVALFMLLAGLNFGLYYSAVRGSWREVFTNTELRFYLALNAVVIAFVTVAILPRHDGVLESLRFASFQVLSVTTTTGFMTEDFDTYPPLARLLLFGCMFIGGCAGSTAGGLKAIRIVVLIRVALREVRTSVQPSAVIATRLGDRAIPPSVVSAVLVFFAAYLLLFAFGSTVMVALGLDLATGTSATIACLSSIGPGLAGVGPSQNFDHVPGLGKLVLSFCMICGRLEIFSLFAVFTKECWRR